LLFKRLDYDVLALTTVRIASLPHAALDQLCDTHPRLARTLWLSTGRDAAIHREWLLSVGQRPGIGRVAHLLCEMYTRNQAVGLIEDASFGFPLTQLEIGEACGITPVHTNRMLQQLRRSGLINMAAGRVTILDWDGLALVAEFDPGYLCLDAPPSRGDRRTEPGSARGAEP
jgi:CRP-like cAMP-binding protein